MNIIINSAWILFNQWPHAIIPVTLGIRLAVGRRTLDPLGQVRILDPQPIIPNLTSVHGLVLCMCFNRVDGLNKLVVCVMVIREEAIKALMFRYFVRATIGYL